MAEPVPAREQVMAAISAVLTSLYAATSVDYQRNRTDDIPLGVTQAVTLMDGGHEQDDDVSLQTSRYDLFFDLLLDVEGSAAMIGPMFNALWAQTVQALHAAGTFNGLVFQLAEQSLTGTEPEDEIGRQPLIAAIVRWRATFFTPYGDPYTVLQV